MVKNNILIMRKPDGKRSQTQVLPAGMDATITALETKTGCVCPNRAALLVPAEPVEPSSEPVTLAPAPPNDAEASATVQLRELVSAQQQIIACLQKDNARLAVIGGQKDDIIHSINKTLAEVYNMTLEIRAKVIV